MHMRTNIADKVREGLELLQRGDFQGGITGVTSL
jgi:hypothetical protein